MFSSFEKIMCLQSLFLSDSECSGGAYFEREAKYYASVADCSAGVKMTQHLKVKFENDGVTQTVFVNPPGLRGPGVYHEGCEPYRLPSCTCDGSAAMWTEMYPGRIHFISIHFRILLVT